MYTEDNDNSDFTLQWCDYVGILMVIFCLVGFVLYLADFSATY